MVNALKNNKALKGWKTISFNTLALTPMLIEALGWFANTPALQGLIPPEYLPFYTIAVALANIGLRYLTTTPVGKNY